MTVAELFERFSAFFDKIVYFDETNNIEDSIELRDCKDNIKTEKYIKFIFKYGLFKVIDWRFDNHNNHNNILIDIKKGE